MKIDSMVSSTMNDTTFSLSLRAQSVCERAKELEEAGEFEEAREAISEFWQRIGEIPQVEGLDEIARAEVLLRAGALSGWIGSARQITGAQEIAKDLISKGAGAFEKLGLIGRVAEARIDLATCYWREGAYDEARITLDDALLRLGDLDSEQKLRVFLNKALVERTSKRYADALQIHRQAAPLFELSSNHTLKGKFHNEYALVLKNLGLAEHRDDYIDRALIEFSAASFHFEQARHERFQSVVENNLGFLFVHLGRFQDAHKHLSRARAVAVALKDQGLVAQFDDTRARAFIAQGQFSKADTIARSSVKALEDGDQLSMLAEALTTHGTALARLGHFSKARATLEKAIRTAQNAGDPESGGMAALSMAEELATHLPLTDLRAYYRMAESELVNSQSAEIQNRLGKCARLILATGSHSADGNDSVAARSNGNGGNDSQVAHDPPGPPDNSVNASLEEQVLHYEGNLIKQALETADGSVTRAARVLGVTHQGLAFILNGRHKSLLAARKPVKRRRRSIIRFH
ncbi:MAG: helix-turn-helix domain-containing protein [Pyrinomonadaceae bacterium]